MGTASAGKRKSRTALGSTRPLFQLDDSLALKKQLQPLSGSQLEDAVAAILAANNYFVLTQLRIRYDGQTISDLDVFATMLTPYHESRVAIECKGGDPTPEEIRKFSAVPLLLTPKPDEALLVCKPRPAPRLLSLARRLQVRLLERTDLSALMSPLLGTRDKERIAEVNQWLAVYHVMRALSACCTESPAREQLAFAREELWWTEDADQQLEQSIEQLRKSYRDSASVVAKSQGVDVKTELRKAESDKVQAAFFAGFIHRLVDVYAVARGALEHLQASSAEELVYTTGKNLRDAIVTVAEHPRPMMDIAAFFLRWVAIWGGCLRVRDVREPEQLARELRTTASGVHLLLETIQKVFTSSTGSRLCEEYDGLLMFKHVPAAFRALGRLHRVRLGLMDTEGQLFKNDAAYLAALQRLVGRKGVADISNS